MSLASPPGMRAKSRLTKATIALLTFLGVSALAGGTAMTLGLGNDSTMLPDEWLANIPLIDSWLIPGLMLGAGFGLGSLFVAYGLFRRPAYRWSDRIERAAGQHWAWLATVVIGAGHVVWIALQLVFLPGLSWLQILYATIGIALVALPLTPAVRADFRTEALLAGTGARR